MGVKGLFQFLKRYEKDIYIPQYVFRKSVGIDIFWFLHKSKGDIFSLESALLPILNNAREVHCVFDGSPPEYKKCQLKEQAQKRKELYYTIEQLENALKYPFNHLTTADKRFIKMYINQLRRQAWIPPPEYVDYVKSWLVSKGCHIYQAVNEADDILIGLEKNGMIDIIITNDSDLLVLGSNMVLRQVSPMRGTLFSKEYISDILGFTAQQWRDFMYLCKNMKDKDVLLAYSLISVYKDLDIVFEKYYNQHKENLINMSEVEKVLEVEI